MILTIDIGNTNINFVLYKKTKPLQVKKVKTQIIKNLENFNDVIKENFLNKKIKKILISNVSVKLKPIIFDFLLLNKKAHLIKPSNFLTITNKEIKEKIDYNFGSDILLSYIFLVNTKKPGIIFDLGSIYDVVFYLNHNEHGISFLNNINNGTKQIIGMETMIDKIDENQKIEIKYFGKTNKNAIESGLFMEKKFYIESIIKIFRNKYPNLQVFLTGGESKLISKILDIEVIYKETLVNDAMHLINLISIENINQILLDYIKNN